jgi:hypothetical protein
MLRLVDRPFGLLLPLESQAARRLGIATNAAPPPRVLINDRRDHSAFRVLLTLALSAFMTLPG